MSDNKIEINVSDGHHTGKLEISIDNGFLMVSHMDNQGRPRRCDSFGHEDLVQMINWALYTRESGMPSLLYPGQVQDRMDDFLSNQHYQHEDDLDLSHLSVHTSPPGVEKHPSYTDLLTTQIEDLYSSGYCTGSEHHWLKTNLDVLAERFDTLQVQWGRTHDFPIPSEFSLDLIHAIVLDELEHYKSIEQKLPQGGKTPLNDLIAAANNSAAPPTGATYTKPEQIR